MSCAVFVVMYVKNYAQTAIGMHNSSQELVSYRAQPQAWHVSQESPAKFHYVTFEN